MPDLLEHVLHQQRRHPKLLGLVGLEFVPLEELGSENPTRLTLDQVEIGPAYGVLISTVAGIWAYDLGDVVRFTSLTPPKIVFAGRSALQLNDFGEHVIEEHLERAMAAARTLPFAPRGNSCSPRNTAAVPRPSSPSSWP